MTSFTSCPLSPLNAQCSIQKYKYKYIYILIQMQIQTKHIFIWPASPAPHHPLSMLRVRVKLKANRIFFVKHLLGKLEKNLWVRKKKEKRRDQICFLTKFSGWGTEFVFVFVFVFVLHSLNLLAWELKPLTFPLLSPVGIALLCDQIFYGRENFILNSS